MATRSKKSTEFTENEAPKTGEKKWKYTPFVKTVCLLLAAVCAFSGMYCAVVAARQVYFYGADILVRERPQDITETPAFSQHLLSSVVCVARLAYATDEQLQASLLAQKEPVIQEVVELFRAKKAELVREQLCELLEEYQDYQEYRRLYDEDISDEAVSAGSDAAPTVDATGAPPQTPSPTAPSMPAGEATIERTPSPTEPSMPAGEPSSAGEAATERALSPIAAVFASEETAADVPTDTSAVVLTDTSVVVMPEAVSEQPTEALPHISSPDASELTEADVAAIERILRENTVDALLSGALYVEDRLSAQSHLGEINLRVADIESGTTFYIEYSLSDAQATQEAALAYDSLAEDIGTRARHQAVRLAALVNFRYRLETADGEVYTNTGDAEFASATTAKRHAALTDGVWTTQGFAGLVEELGSFDSIEDFLTLRFSGVVASVNIWLADEMQEGDVFYALQSFYDSNNESLQNNIICAVLCLLLLIGLLLIGLNLAGHKNENAGITLSFIDRLPGDVHTLLSGGLLVGGTVLIALLIDYLLLDNAYSSMPTSMAYQLGYSPWLPTLCGAIAVLLFLVGAEWLYSLVRIKKARKSWFDTFLSVQVLLWCWHLVVRIWRCIVRNIKKISSVFAYKPKQFSKKLILMCAALFFVNFVVMCLMAAALGSSEGFLFFLLFVLLFAGDVFVLYCTLRYVGKLDAVVVASSEHTVLPDSTQLPQSLRILNDNLQYTNAQLNKAVASAMRDERTKTALITNVSHDLKTPLTSVISYVDLLKKCEITDETTLGYIAILEEKSAKLKRLIEDLLEASKVSTGNVTLNRVSLDLAELALQAVVEHAPEFEKQGLDLRYPEPEGTVPVFADGQKTYRIFENLLTNAYKYSAPASRIYVRTYRQDEYGVFEIKNISREPLNISAEELTDRFVRGDRSRNTEGNGLGLSIAKELCALHGGSLELHIDGDLFKATVRLPATDR